MAQGKKSSTKKKGAPTGSKAKTEPLVTAPEPEPPPVVETTEEPVNLVAAVDDAIKTVKDQLGQRGAAAELLRLLQVRKELTDKNPTKVTVQWINNWDEVSDET